MRGKQLLSHKIIGWQYPRPLPVDPDRHNMRLEVELSFHRIMNRTFLTTPLYALLFVCGCTSETPDVSPTNQPLTKHGSKPSIVAGASPDCM
ncbi:MAG: hypothetical protein AAFU85_08645 [Planctomycetota bacterium]